MAVALATRAYQSSVPALLARSLTSYADFAENAGLPIANDNLIYNGAAEIDTISASDTGGPIAVPAGVTPYMTVDGWSLAAAAASVMTVQKISGDGPPGHYSYFRLANASATVKTLTADQIYGFYQTVEGLNRTAYARVGFSNFAPITVSFFARSSIAGYTGGGCIQGGVYPSGNIYGYGVFEYTLPSANTWYYVTWTFLTSATSANMVTAFPVGSGTQCMRLCFSAGCYNNSNVRQSSSTGLTTSGTVSSAQRIIAPTTETINGIFSAAATNTLDITGIKLEVGAYATPYKYESIDKTMDRRARYYDHTWNSGNKVGSTPGSGSGEEVMLATQAAANNTITPLIKFRQIMALIPNNIYIQEPTSATASTYRNTTRNAQAAATLNVSHQLGFNVTLTSIGATQAVNDLLRFHWLAACGWR